MKTIITSKFLSLGGRDFLNALLLAVLAPLLWALQQWADAVKNGLEYHIDWKATLMAGVSAGIIYLAKNLLTPSKIIAPNDGKHVVKVEPTKEDRVG